MRHDDVTREIKIPTDAELLSEIGGELPNHGHTSYDERCDLDVTQRLPAIPDGECACHAPNPNSARDARDAFNAVMGEPLRLWDYMMAELRGER